MALSANHVKNFCQGDHQSGRDTCRYLSQKMSTAGYVPVCTKMCKDKSKTTNSWATGDNCAGFVLMLHVLQGYDQTNT